MDIIELLKNPLVQENRPAPFLRLVLAEAARYGMPPQVVATLDDVAAMLGFYEPLSKGASGHLSGPLSAWRTDPRQPQIERISEIEALAMKQRALVAFGGAPPGHMVGTAEIVCAMANTHRGAGIPDVYYEIFTWASTDVLNKLTGETPDEIRKPRKWSDITDDDVLKPTGRLNSTYNEIATHIRRTAISAMENDPDNPRIYLRPIAAHFLEAHERVLELARANGQTKVVESLEGTVAAIKTMFADLTIGQDNAEGAEAK